MKQLASTPRLIRWQGHWVCAFFRWPFRQYVGHGDTPKEAFDDWKANK